MTRPAQEPDAAPPPPPPFPEHLKSALQRMRGAVTELLVSVGADPSRPQEVARRFGVNRNLAWKISKIIAATDISSAVPHLPGSSGMDLLVKAMEKHGADPSVVADTRSAVRDLDRVVEIHAGDRATLTRMVAGLSQDTQESAEALAHGRKLAFQGNSGTWGVQARAHLVTAILAPNADDRTSVDLALVNGLIGFRRLRPDARWLLLRRESWNEEGTTRPDEREEALDPEYAGVNEMPLLGRFCTQPIPKLDLIETDTDVQYELPGGPVGNTAAMTLFHGVVSRGIGSIYGDAEGPWSEVGGNLITPIETMQLDYLVHEELAWAMEPHALVCGRLDGEPVHRASSRDRNRLPVSETIYELGRGVAPLATPLYPRYTELLRAVFERLTWPPESFRAFRFTIAYPPIPSMVVMRSRLLPRPT